MKRCPECRRDYYDETLLYCLDDGHALLEGPASGDEAATAILTPGASEAPTWAQSHSPAKPQHQPDALLARPRKLLGIVTAIAIVLAGGFFGFQYLTSPKQIESIAVLPFVNVSGNEDIEYLSDGMTETLIRSLSGIPGLDIKPRSAVFRYKGKDIDPQTVAKDLKVQAVLSGRVDQRGEHVMLGLELVDIQKNSVIWTQQYQREQNELVSLQSEIAKDVSTNLRAKLSSADEMKITRSATSDPDAYQAYLRGRYFWNKRTTESINKAIEQFKIATDRDPSYALAYAGLGDCYVVLPQHSGIPMNEADPVARAYAERSIALDGQLAEPHATVALVYLHSWEWAKAETEFKRAIEIDPNYPTAYHWYSLLLRGMGRNDEAEPAINRARELDPLSSVIAVNIADLYQTQHRHQESIEVLNRVLELDPAYAIAHEDLAVSYVLTGRHNDAIQAINKALELSKRDAITVGAAGFVYALAGKRAEAWEVIRELETKYSRKEANTADVAAPYVGLGEIDKAFEWLEKGIPDRRLGPRVRWSVVFEPLRGDPRFNELLKRMGLPA